MQVFFCCDGYSIVAKAATLRLVKSVHSKMFKKSLTVEVSFNNIRPFTSVFPEWCFFASEYRLLKCFKI
jgi:hypothetical protein